MGYKNIEHRRAYHREYMRQRREMYRKAHLCVECGKEDAFTMAGRLRCADCTEKRKEWDARSREKNAAKYSASAKLRTVERRNNRDCTVCGIPLPPVAYPYVMCEKCRARSRIRLETKRRNNGILPRQMRKEFELCMKCGKPRMNGLTAWGGEPIQLCEKCYADSCKAAAIGRNAATEKLGTTWGNYQYEYEHRFRHGQSRTNP